MAKKKDKNEKTPFKIQDSDFHYNFEVSYKENKPCQNGSDCCDNDYCRCGTLYDMRLDENPSWEKIEYKLDLKNYSDLEKYLIDRILKINNIYEKENWEVTSCGGYYGEEIDGINLDSQIAIKVDIEVNEVLSMDDTSKQIEYILNLEYGYVLPGLGGKIWNIEIIDKDLIQFGNKYHYLKLDKNLVKSYEDYPLARGICLKDGDKYRVIDGYHRLMAGKKEVKIITEAR